MRKFKAVYAKQYDSNGETKTSWKQLGFANEIEKDGKVTIHLTLDAIPTGTWDGEIKLFLQDEQPQQNQGQGQQQQGYNPPPVQYEQQQQNGSYRPQ